MNYEMITASNEATQMKSNSVPTAQVDTLENPSIDAKKSGHLNTFLKHLLTILHHISLRGCL